MPNIGRENNPWQSARRFSGAASVDHQTSALIADSEIELLMRLFIGPGSFVRSSHCIRVHAAVALHTFSFAPPLFVLPDD